MLLYIVQGIAYGLAAAGQPGPFQTYLILQTLAKGWRHSLFMVFAPLLSDGPIIFLVLVALTRIPLRLMHALEIAGGLFVVFLAWRAFSSWRDHLPVVPSRGEAGRAQTLFQAVLVNLLNPNPYLFWSLVTGPILLTGWREAPVRGVGMLAAFYLTMTLSSAAIILLFTFARRLGTKTTRGLQLLSAIALSGFGLYHIGAGVVSLCGF